MTQIAIILLIETVMFVVAYRQKLVGLQIFVIVNLFAIFRLGSLQTDYFIGISNIGNLFYAPVLSTIALIVWKRKTWNYDISIIRRTVWLSFVIICGFFALRYAAIEFNTINQSAIIDKSYAVLESSVLIFIAAFTAFGASTIAVVSGLLYLPFPKAINYLIAITGAELVDSAIFFFIAFFDFNTFLQLFLVGFLVKCFLHYLFLPLALYLSSEDGVVHNDRKTA